jgi:hypothetical protein
MLSPAEPTECGQDVPAGQQKSAETATDPVTHDEPPLLDPPELVDPLLLLLVDPLVDPLLLLVDPLVDPLLLLVDPLVDPLLLLLVDPLLDAPPLLASVPVESIAPPQAPTAEVRRTKRKSADASWRSMPARKATGMPATQGLFHRGIRPLARAGRATLSHR